METSNKNHLVRREEELAKLIGFQVQVVEKIEARLNKRERTSPGEFYLCGLQEEAINTSLSDFYEILLRINELNHAKEIAICDIGASYAKMAFVANHFFPNIRVISIEPVKERIDYAAAKLSDSKHIFINDIFHKDLIKDYKIDYFFLYFPVGKVLNEIITEVDAPIIAIESHGELLNRLGHSFSHKKKLTKLTFPRHNPYSFIFSHKEETRLFKAFEELQEKDDDLMIIDDQNPWLADSEGLKHYFDDEEKITLELKCPPRTIYFTDGIETVNSCNLSQEIQQLIQKRRANEKVDGYLIRKIFLDGSFELSSGEIRKRDFPIAPEATKPT
ncbi:hypothetical protein M902_2659 [Bacteriovorax sp. BAL6_X]|uniref:hypothetical protein n=1 Tax=Bacteriovorax sp. BAL6_X TaxID=1201290 RepID=UPI000386EC79|nr:hypothetical protein [Bacteriovorax sp. BAL6_X]EPZ51004.1 hypothetical protein M902_2659 [Bacteriovorax sp. BAL6_X]